MKPASTTPTALLLIDIQQGFNHPTHWGTERSTPDFEANVAALLQTARAYNAAQAQSASPQPILIIHTHHHSQSASSPLNPTYRLPGSTIPAVAPMDYAAPVPSERVLTKSFNSAFVGTDLEAQLRAFGARQLVLAGLTTEHCVSTTARFAANLQVLGGDGGADGSGEGTNGVIVVGDATAAWARGGFGAETVHAVHLVGLDGEFAQVRRTSEVVGAVMNSDGLS